MTPTPFNFESSIDKVPKWLRWILFIPVPLAAAYLSFFFWTFLFKINPLIDQDDIIYAWIIGISSNALFAYVFLSLSIQFAPSGKPYVAILLGLGAIAFAVWGIVLHWGDGNVLGVFTQLASIGSTILAVFSTDV